MTWLATTFIKSLSFLILILPRRVQLFFGDVLGLTWFYIVPIRRRLVLENLGLCFPEWNEKRVWRVARDNYRNYGRGLIEFLWLPRFDSRVFEKHFIVEGFENYKQAMAQNKGLFFLTLHLGTWELMSACNRELKVPLHVLTKKFKQSGLNSIWVNLRLDRGIHLIREEKSTFQILKAIRGGNAVAFILDQFMGPPVGVRTLFFKRETGTMAALALFADRTRAPVVPVYNFRQKDGKLRIVFEPPVEFLEQGSTDQNISFMTQVYTSKLEEIVKKYPEQWLWLHRRWKPFRD